MTGPWALATAGGKDATLALDRARAAGLEVSWGLNVFEGSTGLVRFHGIPEAVLARQLRALGLAPRFDRTGPEESGRDFERAFVDLLATVRDDGAVGVIFGNVHLAEIRAWYEERVRAAGLLHREPLWDMDPIAVAGGVVDGGWRATVVSVHLDLGDPAWLGRVLDRELLAAFAEAGIDPCGERGEYHTFVHDGPGFEEPVRFRVLGEAELEGHRFLRIE